MDRFGTPKCFSSNFKSNKPYVTSPVILKSVTHFWSKSRKALALCRRRCRAPPHLLGPCCRCRTQRLSTGRTCTNNIEAMTSQECEGRGIGRTTVACDGSWPGDNSVMPLGTKCSDAASESQKYSVQSQTNPICTLLHSTRTDSERIFAT